MSQHEGTASSPGDNDRRAFPRIPLQPRPELLGREWADLTPTERFERFHGENPRVYGEIVRRCREWRAAGHGKLGMSLLFGIVRWQLALQTKGDPYRINDHYAPFYARLVMAFEPDLTELFNLRSAPDADAWIADLKGRVA